jgi:hypothetical protein
MKTYVYYYKSDSSNEVIGRIDANDLNEAHVTLMEIKRLPYDAVVSLFEIKQVRNNEDFI